LCSRDSIRDARQNAFQPTPQGRTEIPSQSRGALINDLAACLHLRANSLPEASDLCPDGNACLSSFLPWRRNFILMTK